MVGFGLALGLVTAGLLSSTLTAHLGSPERAWRAFSQWRTSWLSREGVMAVLTYIPAEFLALDWMVFQQPLAISALLTALCAIADALHDRHDLRVAAHDTPMAPAVDGADLHRARTRERCGAAQCSPAHLWYREHRLDAGWRPRCSCRRCAEVELLACDRHQPRSATRSETATGLGHLGKVRVLEPPHTQPNFVMREMGYHDRAQARGEAAHAGVGAWFCPSRRGDAADADTGAGRGLAGASLATRHGRGPDRRALAVLRRGRTRVDALLRGGCGLSRRCEPLGPGYCACAQFRDDITSMINPPFWSMRCRDGGLG